MIEQKNVLGTELSTCSLSPKTGFYRDGSCQTDEHDRAVHSVCAIVSDEFLQYSKSAGNDLITPMPQSNFPGLRAGDRWCLCAMRWHEAHLAGVAPPLYLQATHARVLDLIDLDILLPYALDLPQNA